MLAFAARHLDSLHNTKQSNRALHHTIKAVRAVNEQLQRDTYPPDDGTVFSVALLAITEVSVIFSDLVILNSQTTCELSF